MAQRKRNVQQEIDAGFYASDLIISLMARMLVTFCAEQEGDPDEVLKFFINEYNKALVHGAGVQKANDV